MFASRAKLKMVEDNNASICGACSLRCLHLHSTINNFNSNGISFFKVMQGNFSTFLEIPIPFKLEDEDDIRVVLMSQSGQLWTAKLCSGYGELADLRDGWESFASDHSLSQGDVVVFNHICDTSYVVRVFGSNGHEKYSHRVESESCVPENKHGDISKQIVKVGTKETKKHVIAREKKIACKSAVGCQGTDLEMAAGMYDFYSYHTPMKIEFNRTCLTEKALEQINKDINWQRVASEVASRLVGARNPNFGKWLTDCAVTKEYRLSIPREYSKIWPNKMHEVILTNHDDHSRLWKLNVLCYDRFYGFSYGRWKKFVQAYNLKKGDICVFELVDTNHFKIYIRKLEDQKYMDM